MSHDGTFGAIIIRYMKKVPGLMPTLDRFFTGVRILTYVFMSLCFIYIVFGLFDKVSNAQESKQKFCMENSTDKITMHISYTEYNACLEYQSLWSWVK